MARQNRVNPFGDLVAVSDKGDFMGNRGCLHDEHGSVTKRSARKAWVTCRTQWKGIRRPLMSPGKYTELFFLDEATALAAGHRPCNDCRKADYAGFKMRWQAGQNAPDFVPIAAIDEVMHRERIDGRGAKITFEADLGTVPAGAMVTTREEPDVARLVWAGKLWRWSFAGYDDGLPIRHLGPVTVLTPRSTCAAISAGYRVGVHQSVTTQTGVMFYLISGCCPFCGQGMIGYRLCSDLSTIVMLCDECDAVWLNPEDLTAESAVFPDSSKFVVPGLNCSIGQPLARWASKTEILAAGMSLEGVGEHELRPLPR